MNRWTLTACGFLLLATALSYLDRQALSVVAPVVAREYRLDNAQLGLLLSAFFYAYSALHIPMGWILDRYNIRWTYAIAVACWSVSQMAGAFAGGFRELWMARFSLGVFETAGQTGAARIIARIIPGRDRSFANGLMMSGGSIGAIIAPPLMIALANSIGWRQGFLVLGSLGLLWAGAFVMWFRPGPDVLYGKAVDRARQEPVPALLRRGDFWLSAAAATLGLPILHISSSWIPTYFVQQWNLPLAASLSVYLFLIYLGLDLGFIGGGALVSWWIRRGAALTVSRRRVLILATVLMALGAMSVPWAPRVEFAVFGVFLLNLGRAAWGAIFLSLNQDLSPTRVGFVAGAMGCLGALSGAQLVWLIGVISKSSGFHWPFLMIGALAICASVPLLIMKWREESQAAHA